MTEIIDMISEIREFIPFHKMENLLLSFSQNTKSKLWTIEILTNHINKIVNNFVESDFETIDDFFKDYLKKLFPSSNKYKQRYCYTMILSFLYFMPRYNYLRLYYDMFRGYSDKNIYFFFYSCKNIIFSMKSIYFRTYVNLDTVYIQDSEWIYVLNQILNFEMKEIKQFRNQMNLIVKKVRRSKNISVLYFKRNHQYNLTFFLREALGVFRLILQNERNDKLRELEKFKLKIMIKGSISTNKGKIVSHPIKPDFEEVKIPYEAKLKEKESLIKRIKNKVRKNNQYKISCLKLMAYIHEIDPIFTEIKELIKTNRNILMTIKRDQIQGRKHEEFTNQAPLQLISFLERGSTLNDKNSKQLHRMLLNTDIHYYKILSKRKQEKIPQVRRLIRELRSKIFDDNFTLFKGAQSKNISNLHKELEKIFGRFDNLKNSDYIILNTYFKNYDTNHQRELSMQNVLSKVTNKLIHMVNNVLSVNEEEESTPDQIRMNQNNLRTRFDTHAQKLKNIEEKDDFLLSESELEVTIKKDKKTSSQNTRNSKTLKDNRNSKFDHKNSSNNYFISQ